MLKLASEHHRSEWTVSSVQLLISLILNLLVTDRFNTLRGRFIFIDVPVVLFQYKKLPVE